MPSSPSWRRWAPAALLVAVVGLLPGCATGGQDRRSSPRPPAEPVAGGFATGSGILDVPEAQLDADMAAMAAAGGRFVRFDVDWSRIERTKGQPDWTTTDRVVAAARRHRLRVLGLLTYTPRWARPSGTGSTTPPLDPAHFAAFAGAAAARYGVRTVPVWEIWNEPNASQFWSPRPSAPAYAELLAGAAAAIRAASPRSTVLTGGLSPYGSVGDVSGSGTTNPVTFLEQVYDAGAQGSFDAVGMHPYSVPAAPGDEEPWNAFQQLPDLHRVMVEHGDGAKRIWSTEYGAPTSGSDAVDEATQARWVTEAFDVLARWPWAGPLLWYSHRDIGVDPGDREHWFGLRRADGAAKPAAKAYRRAVR